MYANKTYVVKDRHDAHPNPTNTYLPYPPKNQQLQVVKPAMEKVLANKKAAKFLLKE